MSGRNHYRAAVVCSRLTGTSYGRCVAWEKQGLISLRQPVPDADTVDQRSFEALIVNVLANVLKDRQVGAAFGVVGVFPAACHVTLRLHPIMAGRVLWELLPRYDSAYGGVHGVPGMRIERRRNNIVLRDLLTQARVLIAQPADSWSMMRKLFRSERPLWIDCKSPHESEIEDRTWWAAKATGILTPGQAAGRDWLLSRMLRRPVLINKTCRKHGWANTYTHEYEDLVIEWCCDDTPAALARQLRDAGLTAWPDDPQVDEPRLGKRHPSFQNDPGVLWLGNAEVNLRRGHCSGDSPVRAMRDVERREWYL